MVNSGLLKFSDDQKVRVDLNAETGEVIKAVTIDADDVETPIGGGGGSSLKMVNIKVVNNLSDAVYFYAPIYSDVGNTTNYFENIPDGETMEFKCVIPNNGGCNATLEDGLRNPVPKGKISMSGDVSIDEFASIDVRGECILELND